MKAKGIEIRIDREQELRKGMLGQLQELDMASFEEQLKLLAAQPAGKRKYLRGQELLHPLKPENKKKNKAIKEHTKNILQENENTADAIKQQMTGQGYGRFAEFYTIKKDVGDKPPTIIDIDKMNKQNIEDPEWMPDLEDLAHILDD